MIFGIYAIRDVHTGFLAPTVDANDNVAKRNFAHAVSREESLFYTHPSDYSLYKIGTYDSDTALIDPINPPKIVMQATDVPTGGAIFV